MRPSAAPARLALTSAGPFDPNQRLIIQESGDDGAFVYTIVDRTTGQVVTQLACETVLDMRQPDGFVPSVVAATA